MAQAGTLSPTTSSNWHTSAIPPVEDRRQQGRQQREHDKDHRFHIPDDEQEFQIDEYV
jgi:hypothetical protein